MDSEAKQDPARAQGTSCEVMLDMLQKLPRRNMTTRSSSNSLEIA